MTLPLIQIFFSLVLLLLWFFLVNLKERYLELSLKGWSEMSLGVFLIFLGSLIELGENIPALQDYLFSGNNWGEFGKIALYVIGVVLVCYSPLNWLPLILEARAKSKQASKRSEEIDSFLAELNKSSFKLEIKDAISSILDFTLGYLCRELKADSGAFFLLQTSERELTLARSLGLSREAIDNLRTMRIDSGILASSLKDKRIETAGELLNTDRRLAFALKEDNLESCICIPLFSEEETFGLVALFSRIKYHFENPDLVTLSRLSQTLSGRIQNLMKIETLEQKENELKIAREKEKFLRLIAEDLVKENQEETFHRIVKAGAEIFHPCDCKIYLREEEALSLEASSASEVSEENIYSSINDWLKEKSTHEELKLLSEDQNLELKERGIKKVVAFPLGNRENPSGVLILECKARQGPFSLSELDFVRTLAFQATEALRSSSLNKALVEGENLIDSILDSVEDRVTIYDNKLRAIKINKAGLRFLNLNQDEVLGKSCFEVTYHQDQSEACPCYLSFKEKKPSFQEIKLSKEKSGREGSLKVWAYPLLDDKGEVKLVVEYAKFEEEEKLAPVLDSGKKEVPKEFFNDLNNILAGILGNAELIMFQLKPFKDFASDMVSDQVHTIEELVIQGSKLIREAKGEIEQIPEKKKIPEKEFVAEEEKKKDESLKILAIDDQKIIRDLLESILQGLGHNIKVASSGKDGLELFQQDSFDLVITDLGMPEMSGWEVSQRVKEMKKETPVVLITGWGVSFDSEKIKEFGVDYLLPKPFRVEQLSKLIDQIRDEKIKKEA